jgi:hypothetical protein
MQMKWGSRYFLKKNIRDFCRLLLDIVLASGLKENFCTVEFAIHQISI